MAEKITRTICFDCHAKCGILVHTDGDQIVKVEGDPNHPNSLGMLCCKAFSAKQIHEHPDRLKYPLKRVGPRGSGEWERITWDEAIETIASKIEEYTSEWGPGAFIISQGTGRGWNGLHFRLDASYGYPGSGLGVSHVCLFPVIGPCQLTWGYYNALDGCDLDNTNCIVHWGINPAASFPGIHMPKFFEARKRGAKLIVIDPRFTDLAAKADLWLQIKPGTDGALALTFCNILIQEDLYDHEFVENWCYGFDEFAEHVKDWTPERCEEETWIPAEKIVEAVHMIMEGPCTEAAMIGTGMHDNGITNGFTMAAFWALTGNLDRKGGITSNEFWDFMLDERLTHTGETKRQFVADGYKLPGADLKPFSDLISFPYPRAALAAMQGDTGPGTHPIKGMLSVANDLVMALEDSQTVFDAIMALDFYAVKDYWMTPSAQYADLVLPSSHWIERDDQVDEEFYMDPCPYVFGNKAVDPPGECIDDWEFFRRLGKRLKPEWWPWENTGEMAEWRLKDFYTTLSDEDRALNIDQLREKGYIITAGGEKRVYEKYRKGLERPDGELGFKTPSGRIELWNNTLFALGYDTMPTYYRSQLYNPDKGYMSKYPLILITGCRDYPYYHSAWSNISMQREIEPDPYVEIHPETAMARGIQDGDWCWLFNNTGRIKSRARVTKAVDPRVISIPRLGWKEACKELGLEGFGMFDANPNTLIPQEPSEPKFGTSPMKSWCCEIEKMEK